MTFTYVEPIATDRDRVRAMIPDVIAAEALFSDARIETFLALEGSVKAAVALALETIATDEALVQKVMQTQEGLRTDGARTATALMARATTLRAQADVAARRNPVPVTGKLTTTAPVTPCWPPDANDPIYAGSPYAPARGA